MNNKTKLKVFIGVVIGVIIGASILFAKIVLTKETGGFNIGMAISIIGAMILGAFFSYLLSIKKKKRNNNIPEVDERTILVLKNYFTWAFYFVMIGSGFVSIILSLMNVEKIELGMIFAYQAFVFILVAIGAFVAKRIG